MRLCRRGHARSSIRQSAGRPARPKEHRETLLDIAEAELESVHRLARRMARAAEVAFSACGMNVFQNNAPASPPDRLFAPCSMAKQRAIAAALRAALVQPLSLS